MESKSTNIACDIRSAMDQIELILAAYKKRIENGEERRYIICDGRGMSFEPLMKNGIPHDLKCTKIDLTLPTYTKVDGETIIKELRNSVKDDLPLLELYQTIDIMEVEKFLNQILEKLIISITVSHLFQ